MHYDLLIINGALLRLIGGKTDLLAPGYIAVNKTTIAGVGAMSGLAADASASRTIDASGQIIMPGLVNTHCHAAMTLFRGLADDLPLMTWLNDHIFPAEAATVSPEMVYWCTKLAAAEMILAGTTTVADGYFFEEAAARAFCDCGIRAIAGQGIIDFPAPGVADPADNIDAARQFLDAWQGRNTLLQPALFCHSPYTCGPETLQGAKQLAQARQALLFIHVAETEAEHRQIMERFGRSPVEHLEALGVLDSNTVCVHGVWLSSNDIATLRRTGAKVSTCPESNMKLASGAAPLKEILAAGIPLGLGTDGCASNNDLDLFGEMNTCAKLHKLKYHDPTVLPASKVLAMATLDGARILNLDARIGSLDPGKQADIILINQRQPHLTPFYNADLLVYAAKGADVGTVIIDGNIVLRNRRLLTLDLDETMDRVNELSHRLLPRA